MTAYWKYTQQVYDYRHMLFKVGDIENLFEESDGWIYPNTKYPNPYKIVNNEDEMITHIMVCPVCYHDGEADDDGHGGCFGHEACEYGKTSAIIVGECPIHHAECSESGECTTHKTNKNKTYTITIKVKEKNLDDVVGMIKSNSDYEKTWLLYGGLIESLDWEESK